ncbi:MAG: hypothetical protein HKO62_07140 [Gammaproteobacteria bacterium]|nr:hypothetical protein [Gammaproteobacteria bacterium]
MVLTLLITAADAAAQETPSVDALGSLAAEPVSRLEWGLAQLEKDLNDLVGIDPDTLEPFDPRYRFNVNYLPGPRRIVIEVGRTFPQFPADQAQRECTSYIVRIRSLFGVDRTGRMPRPVSSLAADYFTPAWSEAPLQPAMAAQLDRALYIRAVVAAPLTGVYSICQAGLLDSEIEFLN